LSLKDSDTPPFFRLNLARFAIPPTV